MHAHPLRWPPRWLSPRQPDGRPAGRGAHAACDGAPATGGAVGAVHCRQPSHQRRRAAPLHWACRRRRATPSAVRLPRASMCCADAGPRADQPFGVAPKLCSGAVGRPDRRRASASGARPPRRSAPASARPAAYRAFYVYHETRTPVQQFEQDKSLNAATGCPKSCCGHPCMRACRATWPPPGAPARLAERSQGQVTVRGRSRQRRRSRSPAPFPCADVTGGTAHVQDDMAGAAQGLAHEARPVERRCRELFLGRRRRPRRPRRLRLGGPRPPADDQVRELFVLVVQVRIAADQPL